MHLQLIATALAMIGSAISAPALELAERATADPSAFPALHLAAELSSAAYSGCTGSAFGTTITLQLSTAITDTQGFIGYDTANERIVVSMRGSTSVRDILHDVDTSLVTPSFAGVNFPSGVKIMTGLNTPWGSVHNSVIAEVKRLIGLYPAYSLYSTGHSLGGSLTYLSYIALAQNFPGKVLHSDALAAFPIGNAAFAAFGTAQKGTLWRGNNGNDGVPNMYVDVANYVHYGTEYYSSGTAATTVKCSGERDTACSAGNGRYSVTLGHFSNFGVELGSAGCS